MWIQNGDQVSKMYAGTGALEGRSKVSSYFYCFYLLILFIGIGTIGRLIFISFPFITFYGFSVF